MSATLPCLSADHRYRGCIGVQACADLGTVRCWDGRRLLPVGFGPVEREVKTVGYQRQAPCATCMHAVEVPDVDRPKLEDGRYHDDRLFACELGRWFGLASLYQLNNHRMPLGEEAKAGCDVYQPVADLRPELVAQREADKERARNRRQLLRESAIKKESQPWGEVL